MAAGLGRRLTAEELSDEAKMRALEPELLNRLTMAIFNRAGESGERAAKASGGEGVFFVDFRLLYVDGRDVYASAQRGEYYYTFKLEIFEAGTLHDDGWFTD
jgi:hypothetical protein